MKHLFQFIIKEHLIKCASPSYLQFKANWYRWHGLHDYTQSILCAKSSHQTHWVDL